MGKVMQSNASMTTRFSENVSIDNCWKEHPRPQAERKNWLSLNGEWLFSFSNGQLPPSGKEKRSKILVPYSWESTLSGIGQYSQEGKAFYTRMVQLPEDMPGKRILLHFDAVDWESEVFIDGVSLGIHRGGYDAFSYDITEWIKDKTQFRIDVRVYDPTREGGIPTGKQDARRFNDPRGCMYTPNSGIWQSVWLEATGESYIDDFHIYGNWNSKTIEIEASAVYAAELKNANIQAMVYFDGRIIAGKTGKPGECIQIRVADVQEWCPETPALYEVIIRLMSTSKNVLDEIKSYTAFRKISLMNKNGLQKIALNDQEIFQMGVLDQGYWPDGIYTPPSDAAQAWEIAEMKKLGF